MTEYAALPAEETPTVDYTALRLAAADPGPAIGPAPGKVIHTQHIHSDPPTFLPFSVLTRQFLSVVVLCLVSVVGQDPPVSKTKKHILSAIIEGQRYVEIEQRGDAVEATGQFDHFV
jgi:hypothetical protein